MPKVKSTSSSSSSMKMRPALTPEAEETQLIALAYARAKEQLIDGTASSQVITHFLKMGSEKEKLERERLEEENKLLRAKTEQLQAQKDSSEVYKEVLAALSKYNGYGGDYEDYEEFDDY